MEDNLQNRFRRTQTGSTGVRRDFNIYDPNNTNTLPNHNQPASVNPNLTPQQYQAVEQPPLGESPIKNQIEMVEETPQVYSEQRQKSRKKSRNKLIVAVFTLLIVVIGGGIFVFISQKPSMPIPDHVLTALDFQPFYPSSLPQGYRFMTGSAKEDNGLLFYRLISGHKIITVTEQGAPSSNISASAIPGYSYLHVVQGQAGLGTSLGSPSGILIANSTFVNVSSNGGVSKTVVKNIIQALKTVQVPTSD